MAVHRVGFEVDERDAGLFGQRAGQLVLEDESEADEGLAEEATVDAALGQRVVELGLGDQALFDQQFAKLEAGLLAEGIRVAKPHELLIVPSGRFLEFGAESVRSYAATGRRADSSSAI